MTTVKFDKAVKYQGVRYAPHEDFKVDDADVDQLKAAGATVLATDPVTPASQPEPQADEEEEIAEDQEPECAENVAKLKEELLGYTVAELTEFACERGIDLQKKTKKAEIYNIIVAALD